MAEFGIRSVEHTGSATRQLCIFYEVQGKHIKYLISEASRPAVGPRIFVFGGFLSGVLKPVVELASHPSTLDVKSGGTVLLLTHVLLRHAGQLNVYYVRLSLSR
jgi:hypothetical protein